MRALKVQAPGSAAVVETPVPVLRSPSDLLIKTAVVALNPTDWKHIKWVDKPATVGCDFSGVIEEVGSGVSMAFKKGDRVFGAVHGSNVLGLDDGAFAEYILCDENLCMKIPEGMSFEEASTMGVGIATVGQGMYQRMGLPWPDEPLKKKLPILIYGGSSAMGVFGIQFAKLSGFEVITTCSPRNFDFVKSLGADLVIDYHSPTCAAEIREHTGNELLYAWDTISEESTAQICAEALASPAPEGQKLHYGALVSVALPRLDVQVTFSAVYSATGKAWRMRDMKVPPNREDYEFMKKWCQAAEKWLGEGKIRGHRQDVRSGGLDAIVDGLEDMKNGKVSGVKVVYRVA